MKTKPIIIVVAILFLTSFMLFLGSRNAEGAKDPSERFKGYNTQRDKWVNANLGKEYYEGDWVSYQLKITRSSKVWGEPSFDIKYNFYQPSSDAIYVDGFDTSEAYGFQWSTQDWLPNGQPLPDPGWGTHIPTPDAGETPGVTNIINFMDPMEAETPESPSVYRYFTVENIPWGTVTVDHIILFFRAHLALDIIWSEGLESALPQELDGNEFEGWLATHRGSSFATGSSRHFYLEIPGVGEKAVPIPIAMYPQTVINGHKYVNDVLFNGWEITLTGELSLGPGLPPIPYNPSPVYTGTSPWTTGYFEFTGLVEGSYTVQEEDRPGYAHENIETSGDGTNVLWDIPGGWASFDLPRGGTQTVDFYNSAFEDLTVSKTATPYWEQSFDWTIDKTVRPTELTLLNGETGTVTYTVTITRTVAENLYKVNGTITINNPNPPTVEVYATILDEVYEDAVLIGSQDLTPGGPILIPSGVTNYDYSITLLDIDKDKRHINKVTVEVTAPVSRIYDWEETFSCTAPTSLVDDTATVDEDETVPPEFSAVVNYGTHGTPPWHVTDSTIIDFTKDITAVNVEYCKWYDIPNTVTLTESDSGTVHQASALVRIHGGEPPPKPGNPPSFDFKHTIRVEQILVGGTKTMTMEVYNTGVPQSRIYYLTFTAVIEDYSLLNFVAPYTAHIRIYYNDGSIFWVGDVTGDLTYEEFAGFDIMGDYRMVTWRVPTTYPGGPYLEGNWGGLRGLNARAEISFEVMGVAPGSRALLVFFPRATEDHHSAGVPLSSIADKANIWESDGLWYPVHDSYDPYDDVIATGHAFVNPSWVALPTTNGYAKAIRWIDIVTKST